MEILCLDDLEPLAAARLAPSAYDYYRSGADDELTLARNRAAFERWPLYYRVLVDVSRREQRTTLLGQALDTPILVAPTAFHCLADPEGEVATARAVQRSGSLMILSSLSNRPMEEVVTAAGGRVWFQLYVVRDRGITREVVARAKAAGCQALVITVDAPLLGRRRRDVVNRFRASGLVLSNLTKEPIPAHDSDSALSNYFNLQLDCSLTWKDLEWLRDLSGMPVMVKGLVRADDALRAVEHGASGVVVSNHGGRQLDTSPASLEALPAIAQAVGDRALVLMDGGVRRGTDVLKALALGARGVLLGRPILWGLGAAGEEGAFTVLDHLKGELDLAMALCGAPTLAEITEDLLGPVRTA